MFRFEEAAHEEAALFECIGALNSFLDDSLVQEKFYLFRQSMAASLVDTTKN